MDCPMFLESFKPHVVLFFLSHTYCPRCFKEQMAEWNLPHKKDGHLPNERGDKFESPKNQEDHQNN